MTIVLERVLRGSIPEPNTGCWLWMGATYRSGRAHEYGFFSIKNRRKSVHRASYEAFVGPIPSGLVCRHTCDVTLCVNPEHLVIGTQAENVKDMWERRRAHQQRTPEIGVLAATNANCTMRSNPERRARGERHGMWKKPQLGSENGFSKLTDEGALEIMSMSKAGVSQRTIAKRFNVHQATVWRVINGKNWGAAALRARAAI